MDLHFTLRLIIIPQEEDIVYTLEHFMSSVFFLQIYIMKCLDYLSYSYKDTDSVHIRPEKLQLSNVTLSHCCKDIQLYNWSKVYSLS